MKTITNIPKMMIATAMMTVDNTVGIGLVLVEDDKLLAVVIITTRNIIYY